MCILTQTYYQCGCLGPYVIKEPRCRNYPECESLKDLDTTLPYRCYAHGHGPDLASAPGGNSGGSKTGGSKMNGSKTGGSKTGGGSQR